MSRARATALAGWGRAAWSASDLRTPAGHEVEGAVATALAGAAPRGTIARGQGRAYGDAAQRAGGTVVQLPDDPARLHLDPARGTVTAPAGTSIGAVLRAIVPHGWFVPVTPGTQHVSLGGALAADVHGKNHHRDGSFAQHVVRARLVTPARGAVEVGPQHDPELFWATAGGMGLTGLLTEVTFAAVPVESGDVLVDTWRTDDLDETLAVLADADRSFRYTVGWLDLLARGRALGRGVVTAGEHAPAPHDAHGLASGPPARAVPAPPAPARLLNRATVAAFNRLWHRRAPRRRAGERQSAATFFYPLDAVGGWNRLYGRPGFLQWQVVVPTGAEATLRAVLERLAEAGTPSFLTVLKRFGPGAPGPLSFPREGWTLAIDVPAGRSFDTAAFDQLDRAVVDAGGRTYLAKDARVDPRLVPAMYPDLHRWRATCDAVDPEGLLASDLSVRLGLRSGRPGTR